MRIFFSILIGGALLAAGCAASTAAPPPSEAAPSKAPAPAPLIPREVLFGNPERIHPRLSPDGSRLAYLAEAGGAPNIWVGTPADVAGAKPLTKVAGAGISRFEWTPDSRHILYVCDQRGDENHRVYSLDVTDGQIRDLTPIDGIQARIMRTSGKLKTKVLVALNDRDRRLHDLYAVDFITGERTLVEKNDRFVVFFADGELIPRVAVAPTKEGGFSLFHRQGTEWKPFLTYTMEEATGKLLDLDDTGRAIYAIDLRNRDRGALAKIDIVTGETKVIAEDPQADIETVLFSPVTGEPQAAAAYYFRRTWHAIDPQIGEHISALHAAADGDFEIVSRSHDDAWWVVAYDSDRYPMRYYLYDRARKASRLLFSDRPRLEQYTLSKTHPVLVKARDGLPLVSYVTLPPEAGDTLPPPRRFPMVLYVHGGPWDRDRWGFEPKDQWLANRGYGVLRVNFRGSTGFGRSFINRANGEWAKQMHDDLIDAVQWAVHEGIADPDRVAIMGGSYGGYATLVGLSFTPDVFACGVARVAWSNLITYFSGVAPHASPFMDIVAARVGDPRTEEGRKLLLERSPVTRAKEIRRPLLIGQGENDSRVKPAEAQQLIEAMSDKAPPPIYLLYKGEGHFFRRPASRLSFNALSEVFLEKCLGGRVEPVDNNLMTADVEVRHGAQQLSALTQPTSR